VAVAVGFDVGAGIGVRVGARAWATVAVDVGDGLGRAVGVGSRPASQAAMASNTASKATTQEPRNALVRQADVQADAGLISHHPHGVAGAGDVFEQDDVAAVDHTRFAVGNANLGAT